MPDFVKQSEAQAHELLQQYLALHGIRPELDRQQQLLQISTAFARLPYENLSKIVRGSETGNKEQARRLPIEVLNDHIQLGTGGTCFSLTWTLLCLIRALGFQAEPILADRRYGINTHSALVVWIDGVKHLIDPGYLLVDAIAFPKQCSLVTPTSFHEVKLTPSEAGSKVQLETILHDKSTYRLTYKTDPVDTAQFLLAWDESFQFDMMNYPVLSRIVDGQQLYLQKNKLLVRSRSGSEQKELAPATMPATIHNLFGIDSKVVAEALRLIDPVER